MKRIAISLCLALGLAACSSGLDAVDQDDVVAETESAATAGTKIPFEVLSFNVPSNVGNSVARKVFNTKAEFQAYFGRDVAVPVNFGRYSVAFYSAGQKRTGGFSAQITAIRLNGSRALTITTSLSSPGAGCFVTEAFTKPAVLVAFARPTPAARSVAFAKSDAVTDCNEPATCAATLCKPGTICTERSGSAECVEPVSCAATLCAVGTICTERSGTAECLEPVSCAATLCAVGTTCTEASGTAECIAPTSCAAALCPQDTYCYEKSGKASCIPYQTCENSNVTCGANEYCNNHSIQCITAPCAPTAPVCTPGLTPCATVRCGSAHPQCVVTNGAPSCK
jgi:hypothetical protein